MTLKATLTSRPWAARIAALAMLFTSTAWAVAPPASDRHEQRNFDVRARHNIGFEAQPTAEHLAALDAARAQIPELAVTYQPGFSAPRTIYNRVGYLSAPALAAGAEDLDVALAFLRKNLDLLGLSAEDLGELEMTDSVYVKVSGSTHLYLRQRHQGLPLYNGQLQVNLNRDRRVLSVNNAFLPGLASSVNTTEPAIDPELALLAAADHLGVALGLAPERIGREDGPDRATRLIAGELSQEPIETRLMWLPIRQGEARLVWNFQLATPDGNHWYDINVDAVSAAVLTRFDWTNSGTYRVYQQPVESPIHTTPLPPADARTLAVDPEDATASPSGWFTGGTMAGNNVHACPDTNANNACDSDPQCAGTTCDFPIDLTAAPSASIPAATANLFYWNNIIHDIQYQYGFDEPGGNFQEDNFGNGGAGGDSVNADAQDGSGNCNANFATPSDGGNPRMQMFTCNLASPSRDGDYDNMVIVHEYGHGISIRQVGGPGNSSCLNNAQQAGEGWSDWHGLVYTAEAGDLGADARGVGSYLFNEPANGGGIRDLPYSTDPGVNNWTYESISGASIPHGVGSRWAQAAWEVYWKLVDKWGFEGNLVDFDIGDPNEAGNKRALFYINQGLKNTACSPTFVDNRDGIIQAATDNFGGDDVCDLWEAFAAFGLGTDAVSGGSNSTNPTNGFSIPLPCQCDPAPIADAGPDVTICQGDSATLGTPAQPDNSYSWAPGGETTAQITVSPAVTTTYTVTATTTCGSASDSATVFVDDGSSPGLSEDFEGGLSGWTTTGLWHLTSDSACATPGYSSPVNAVYYGQDATCNYATGAATSGTLTSPTITGITAASTLSFDYFRVVESFTGAFDRTEVEIVTAGGVTTVFALDSSDPSTAAWVSSGAISLASFAGQPIQVRFRFDSGDGVANNFTGWFVDDVVVTGDSPCTPGNTAPVVTITAPADGSSFNSGDTVTFSGTAADAEDGDLSGSLSWTSDLDGAIGAGATFSTSSLSVGTHTITASVTDSGGLPGSDSITVEILGGGTPVTVTFTSIGGEDGWVRESSENSNVGGANAPNGGGSRPIRPGDANRDRQYKAILSFDTSSIPAGATVTAATLRLTRGAVVGTNPFTILGSCLVDVQSGGFSGNTALQNSDFEAPATAVAVASLSNAPSNGDVSEGSFDAAGLAAINANGTTQTRVYFSVDDNDNNSNDYIGYYSGDNSDASRHPQLVVTYIP